MKKFIFLFIIICFVGCMSSTSSMEVNVAEYLPVKHADGFIEPELNLSSEQTRWWENAKFGMFIHWGLYSILESGEWTMFFKSISPEEYAKLADEFNPTNYNPTNWAKIAKQAGMKYVVLTTRHHDGFALWDSKSSWKNFTAVNSAVNRDLIKPYVNAVKSEGLKVGFYYSPMDWRFPGYFSPKKERESAELMKNQCWGQVEELMANYGKIDILWYDGAWLAHKNSNSEAGWLWRPVELNKMVRNYQPEIMISPRSGWQGDFYCAEGNKKVTGKMYTDYPWEKCCNLNKASWGYYEGLS